MPQQWARKRGVAFSRGTRNVICYRKSPMELETLDAAAVVVNKFERILLFFLTTYLMKFLEFSVSLYSHLLPQRGLI